MISSRELYILIESNNNRKQRIANSLINALNDWPTINLTEPSQLIVELRESITGKLTFQKLSSYRDSLDLTEDAWKIEALSSIIEMFDNHEDDDLESIIIRLQD